MNTSIDDQSSVERAYADYLANPDNDFYEEEWEKECFVFIGEEAHARFAKYADDVVSDATMRALRDVRKKSPAAPLLPWLRLILRNTVRDVVRAEQRLSAGGRKVVSIDDAVLNRGVTSALSGERVWKAINTLPKRQRLVAMLLSYGQTFAEIAQVQETSIATVRRDVQAIREAIQPISAA